MTSLLFPMATFHSTIPPVVLFGVAPHFYTATALLRLSKPVLPHSWFQHIDTFMYHTYQSMVVFFFETWAGNRLFFYNDTVPTDVKENVLFISNHQSSIDWSVANFFAIRQGATGGIRYILKNMIMCVPMIGPYLLHHGCTFVGKGVKNQDQKIQSKLKSFVSDTKCTGYWLVLFPEGTRYIPERKDVIEKSETQSVISGYTPFKYLLFPRTKAFELAVEELSESLDAVYDVTLAFKVPWLPVLPNRHGPNLFQMVSISGREIHLHFRRIPISDIPKDVEDRKKWLYDAFEKKEKLLHSFYSPKYNGTFPAELPDIAICHILHRPVGGDPGHKDWEEVVCPHVYVWFRDDCTYSSLT